MSSTLVIGLRLLFAGLSLAGVLTQLVIAIQTHFGVVSFFSYFTILSNIIASCVFIVSAIQLARGHESTARGALTGFYAYPFFDPGRNGGYAGVAAYCAALLVAFVALAFLVRALGNARSGALPTDGRR